MKLSKSSAGKVFIILYYLAAVLVDVILSVFIMFKTDYFWAGLGVSLVLGIGIGILGGELEFREHCKLRHEKHLNGRRVKEPNKIIDFPVQS